MNGDMGFIPMEVISTILEEVAEIQKCEQCRPHANNIAKALEGE